MTSKKPQNPCAEDFDLHAHIPFRVAVLSNLIKQQTSDYYVKDKDMSGRDCRILAIIGIEKNITPADISFTTGIDKTTVTRSLKRLESNGYIFRTPNKLDGRSHHICATELGESALNEILPDMKSNGESFSEKLTAGEQLLFLELLQKLECFAREGLEQSLSNN